MPNNPFSAPTIRQRRIKAMFFGIEGTGKTWAALTFPRPAMIDLEDGAAIYEGREGVPAFNRMSCESLADFNKAIEFIRADGGKTYDTLIIDPITIIFDMIREEEVAKVEKRNKEFKGTDYGKINMRMRSVWMDLLHLPVHVITTAHEAIDYEDNGAGGLKKVGVKIGADKDAGYPFDFVVNVDKKHAGTFAKGRIPPEIAKKLKLPADLVGYKVARLDWSVFKGIAELFDEGEVPVDTSNDLTNEKTARAFVEEMTAQGYTVEFLKEALGIKAFTTWKDGKSAALARIVEYAASMYETQTVN